MSLLKYLKLKCVALEICSSISWYKNTHDSAHKQHRHMLWLFIFLVRTWGTMVVHISFWSVENFVPRLWTCKCEWIGQKNMPLNEVETGVSWPKIYTFRYHGSFFHIHRPNFYVWIKLQPFCSCFCQETYTCHKSVTFVREVNMDQLALHRSKLAHMTE